MHQINPNSSSSQGSRSSPSRSPCQSCSSQVERPRLATDSRNSYSQGCCRFFQNRASDVMGLEVWHESHGATQPLSLSIWDLTPSPGIASPRVCLRGAVSFTTDLGTLSGSSDDPNPAARLFTARQRWLVFLQQMSSSGHTGLWHQASGQIRHLHQQSVVHLWSLSSRPRVFGLPWRGCRHQSGPHCPNGSQGFLTLITGLHHNTFQGSDPSNWLSLYLNLVLPLFHQQTSSIHIQRIPAQTGIPGNTLADIEAKRGSTLPQTSVPVDLATATATVLIQRTGQEVSGPLRTWPALSHTLHLTGETNPQAHWRFGLTRRQCITVAQLRMGHCPLPASYLHRIGRQHSPVCPYCGDDETAQHLLLCSPSHMQACSSTNYINSTDPWCMWSFLESIRAVTRPHPDWEWEQFDWSHHRHHWP